MRDARTLLIVTIAALLLFPPFARGAITAADVTAAIDRGRDYLLREQSPRGTWNDSVGTPGGVTALATLALLNSGVDVDSVAMQKSLKYLRTSEFNGTYTVALQTMVLAAAEPKRDRAILERNVRWFEETQIKNGGNRGAWSYPGSGGDKSNSQFAVLALYEAQRAGIKVDPAVWALAADFWRRTQNPDGSWEYGNNPPSGSMTCAGIGGLVITSLAVDEGDARVAAGRVLCCQQHEDDKHLEAALAWLGQHFSVERNPGPLAISESWHFYYLYGVERAGRLSARRLIGKSDWYREGAEYLVNHQDPLAHFWKGNSTEGNPHIATSMALLFLSKGRWPIVMGKLQHGPGDDWNNHRRDAANLTAYAEKKWESKLTWQIMNPSSATVEDLLQTPVIYISGNRAPELEPYAKKLRDYIDRGGFIFAESCCRDSEQFNGGIRRLMAKVFPEPEYRLQQVPASHPIWRMEEVTRPESPYVGKLWSVEYGCRTCVIFCEEDLSCYWELNRPTRSDEYPVAIEQQIDDAMTIGINVLTYATNREPKTKEQGFVDEFAADAKNQIQGRGTIEVAKLRHGGGCDDAPGALANLLRTASQGQIKLRIADDNRLISAGGDDLFRYHMVFMHGRHDFRFTPAERNNLRKFLENGGTILADSICASDAFSKAFRREMSLVMPDDSLERIEATDDLLSTAHGGYDLKRVEVRDPQPAEQDTPLAARVRQREPELEGLKINDRWGVIFSPLDLSCALEKHEAIECRGYTREDAARIGVNVILYTLDP
ncbi:DUF4159 domain-containing protein [Aeoliella mucimassa]|uniref:DUF4159 domain-containing protein n=1 Tax=Aeoliella mucimassa TaxID=2527972 RepID=A0A518AIH6_9BACT|nr:DUF4159 domain-containing protein [Aeoliella mucimassa]QDU54529.1 hypothetical protein Pan181_07110 [Aeoliella mucimassa]